MKKYLAAAALALAAVAGSQGYLPIAAPAHAEADPFDNARYYIVNKQNAEALKLIDSGAFPIDQGNYEGWTLLHYAAEAGNLDMVKALLERGADPTAKTKYGSLPYDVASATMVKAAIAAAVEARTGTNPMKPTAAFLAAPMVRSTLFEARSAAFEARVRPEMKLALSRESEAYRLAIWGID